MQQRRIFLHNALQLRVFLEIWDEGENDFVPYEGAATIRFSATPGGAALGALHTALLATEEPGVYVANFSSAQIDADLAGSVGVPVYEIVVAGPANELQYVTTYLVTDPRHAP